MKISVIGTGYVGLVTGTCFAEVGYQVTCADTDSNKISLLHNGKIPIWEPGLQEMVDKNHEEGRLTFTDSIESAILASEVIFIAVGTPPEEDGSADLSHVLDVARAVGQYMDKDKIVVDKSTVPIGTADLVMGVIANELEARNACFRINVVSNPEFLKEGAAIEDFMKPDRIVIGVDDPQTEAFMKQLYAPFNTRSDRIISMSVRSAEMTKYAANAMLAAKISFINEIALLCEKFDADVSEVRKGIGSDTRIGYSFIYPGVGYGGSCFPKDVKALIHMAHAKGLTPLVLESIEERNEMQKIVLADKVKHRFGKDLTGLSFGVWGLTFKPHTDDMREAPSIAIIKELTYSGASIKAFDPVAYQNAREVFSDNSSVQLFKDQYQICDGIDALLLITEWPQFKSPDFMKLSKSMKQTVIFDGRNQYDPRMVEKMGFEYYGIGR